MVVEEAGYGSTWAAPIAHLLIEHYLQPDSVEGSSRQYLVDKMKNSNLIPLKLRALRDTAIYGN